MILFFDIRLLARDVSRLDWEFPRRSQLRAVASDITDVSAATDAVSTIDAAPMENSRLARLHFI
jgi:hypothetical protein